MGSLRAPRDTRIMAREHQAFSMLLGTISAAKFASLTTFIQCAYFLSAGNISIKQYFQACAGNIVLYGIAGAVDVLDDNQIVRDVDRLGRAGYPVDSSGA